MPERPDLRQIAVDIRAALDGLDRDSLADILTYVIKEYVVEGPPPLRMQETEQMSDLAGKSFAELITALQTRLDVPELSLFVVEGDQVKVRIDGVPTALSVAQPVHARAASAPDPAPSPARAAAPEEPLDRRSVGEAVARGRGDLVGQSRGVIEAPPPRPGGLRVSGRPAASPPASTPAPSPTAAPQPAATPAQAAPTPPQSAQPAGKPGEEPPKPEPGDDDDASIRFSLLELD